MYFKRWTYFKIYLFIYLFYRFHHGCINMKYTFEQIQYKNKRRWCAFKETTQKNLLC